VAADRREERQAALRAALAAEGLDGLLVTHLPNIRYLTGCWFTPGRRCW
jgi:Xaa-Pro aminopeptidase